MDWPQDFFFAFDDFGRKRLLAMIFRERNVIFVVPVHRDEDVIEMWRSFEGVYGVEDFIGIGNSKRASLTEVVLGVDNDKGFGHDD